MDQVLDEVEGARRIMDDMIIKGKNDEEHLQHLEEVFRKLQEHGLRTNQKKCQFIHDKVTFCGHSIDKHGLHKTPRQD